MYIQIIYTITIILLNKYMLEFAWSSFYSRVYGRQRQIYLSLFNFLRRSFVQFCGCWCTQTSDTRTHSAGIVNIVYCHSKTLYIVQIVCINAARISSSQCYYIPIDGDVAGGILAPRAEQKEINYPCVVSFWVLAPSIASP